MLLMWMGPRTAVAPSSVTTITRLPRGVMNTWSTVGTEYSCPSEVRMANGLKGTRSIRSRTSAIIWRLYQKFPFPHHLFAVEPDIEIAADAVDMRFGGPIRASVLGIGMAKGNVDAG